VTQISVISAVTLRGLPYFGEFDKQHDIQAIDGKNVDPKNKKKRLKTCFYQINKKR